jgi:decaprenyl-phosphate phosphoribosyltransferase
MSRAQDPLAPLIAPALSLTSPAPAAGARRLGSGTIRDYVAIARPDHWCKNAFMVLGVLLAYFYKPGLIGWTSLGLILWAVLATCLIASSNYVLNEVLDAPTDREHPIKRQRPVAAGRIRIAIAYAEWLLLGFVGLAMAAAVNQPFFWSALLLLAMGLVYNVRPARSKDYPYVDVLTESINNPIRLLLGWFAVTAAEIPPVSLLIAYWMVGAFFMATKRFSEFRSIGDPAVAGAYRRSFRWYDERKLLVSMFFYTTCFGLFLGVFIIRYHLELILSVPLIAGFVCYYLSIAYKDDSAAQNPERLYRERGLMLYLAICMVAFAGLMFVHIPVLYEWFNVQPSPVTPLWRI